MFRMVSANCFTLSGVTTRFWKRLVFSFSTSTRTVRASSGPRWRCIRDFPPRFHLHDFPKILYTGLLYPIAVCLMTLVVGGWMVHETEDHRLDTPFH